MASKAGISYSGSSHFSGETMLYFLEGRSRVVDHFLGGEHEKYLKPPASFITLVGFPNSNPHQSPIQQTSNHLCLVCVRLCPAGIIYGYLVDWCWLEKVQNQILQRQFWGLIPLILKPTIFTKHCGNSSGKIWWLSIGPVHIILEFLWQGLVGFTVFFRLMTKKDDDRPPIVAACFG